MQIFFEQFRDSCNKHYELDPAHFYTAPGLSFQAALKMTKVEMELLTDVNMHLFIEAGIRGGVAMISKRLPIQQNQVSTIIIQIGIQVNR